MKVSMNVSSCSMKATRLPWLLKSTLAFEFIMLSHYIISLCYRSFMEASNRKMITCKRNTDLGLDCASVAFLPNYEKRKTAKDGSIERTLNLRRKIFP